MATHHVPKGVSVDTLREILAGWAAVGAAGEPAYTSDVADETGIADAVGRQTKFLEDIGALDADGQQHRLTGRGADLATALDAGDDDAARTAARDLLADWPVTDAVRGVLRGNPTARDDLVPVVAALVDEDVDDDRVRTGVAALLDFFAWAGVLDTDGEGRYRLPETGERGGSADGERGGTAVGDGGTNSGAGGGAAAAFQAALDDATVGDIASAGDGAHALSLRVDLDADPDDLEALVRAIRRGLTAPDGDGGAE